MADAAAKREAAIKEKDEERKKKNAEIAASKKAKQAERDKLKKEEEEKAAAEEAKKAEIAAKREKNVKEKETSRGGGKKASTKYSKRDVEDLHKVFQEYDRDGSGKVTIDEFSKSLKDKKTKSQPRAGEKSTLAQRQQSQGVSILDLSESVFHEMDADGDGDVTFKELLKLMYPYARPEEIETMLEWVAPPPEPEPEPEPELSADAKQQIKSIFKLYDKDKSGSLTKLELKKALEKTGLDADEINGYFKDFDDDDNGEINLEEFMKLMDSTGAFAE